MESEEKNSDTHIELEPLDKLISFPSFNRNLNKLTQMTKLDPGLLIHSFASSSKASEKKLISALQSNNGVSALNDSRDSRVIRKISSLSTEEDTSCIDDLIVFSGKRREKVILTASDS
jgi:hypothetical protein